MYFQVVKNSFYDMLSLKNIISDIEPNVSKRQENFGVKPYISYDFVWNYKKPHNNIKISLYTAVKGLNKYTKIQMFPNILLSWII